MSDSTVVAEPVKQKRTRTTYGLSDEQFVAAWQESETGQEAADKMSKVVGRTIPKAIVLARAAAYRKKGVQIKRMNKKHRKIDVDKLNSRINSLNGNGASE